MRDGFLNGEIFDSLKEARVLAERWRVYCNTERPHSSLGYKPPAPAAWQPKASQRHGKVESTERFPLSHTAYYCDGQISASPVPLHEQTHWYKSPEWPNLQPHSGPPGVSSTGPISIPW
jgi:hypothetical protein